MPSLGRRLLVSGLLGGGCFTATRRPGSASDVAALYEADDGSVAFALPQGWIGVTHPEQERASRGHLLSVRAQRLDGGASLQAVVDGGSRGRRYGDTLRDLGSLDDIAQGLVSNELFNDDDATSAGVVSAEQLPAAGPAEYYVVRYQVGAKPAIAKLAVLQQRLYCLRVRAAKPAAVSFFEEASPLRVELEAVAASFRAVAVNADCLERSNRGRAPGEGACRPLRRTAPLMSAAAVRAASGGVRVRIVHGGCSERQANALAYRLQTMFGPHGFSVSTVADAAGRDSFEVECDGELLHSKLTRSLHGDGGCESEEETAVLVAAICERLGLDGSAPVRLYRDG